MAGQLAGKLALVTGAGSGIGRAVCKIFSREGARVAAVDVNKTNIDETLGSLKGEHHAFEADVSSSASVTELFNNIQLTFSGIPTIAINCAGITRDKLMVKMDEASFDEVINVNLKGTFLINQAVMRLMMQNKMKGGSLVNISSTSGKMGNVGQVNYSASKAGVIGMTKTIAKEGGGFNIRCNAVLPGTIDTPMIQTIPDKLMKGLMMLVPLGRVGTPEELAEACLFLASDRSSYITGAVLEVTGGLGM